MKKLYNFLLAVIIILIGVMAISYFVTIVASAVSFLEALIIIGAIATLIIYLVILHYYDKFDEEDAIPRLIDAISCSSESLVEHIAKEYSYIFESKAEHELRVAKIMVARRTKVLYLNAIHNNDPDSKSRLIEVSGNFNHALEILGLSVERWEKMANEILYLGIIKYYSGAPGVYKDNIKKENRQGFIEYINREENLRFYNQFIEALQYFNISNEDWIQYGEEIIQVYNIKRNTDIEQYGFLDIKTN